MNPRITDDHTPITLPDGTPAIFRRSQSGHSYWAETLQGAIVFNPEDVIVSRDMDGLKAAVNFIVHGSSLITSALSEFKSALSNFDEAVERIKSEHLEDNQQQDLWFESRKQSIRDKFRSKR